MTNKIVLIISIVLSTRALMAQTQISLIGSEQGNTYPQYKVTKLLTNTVYGVESLGNDLLFFYTNYNEIGNGLYKLNKEDNTPILVKEINGGGTNSPMVYMNNVLYFSAYDNNFINNLYRTDGTIEGTYAFNDASDNAYKSELVILDNELYYMASTEKSDRFFACDGSSTRNIVLHDWASPGNLAVSSGLLFFSVVNNEKGDEPYISNGTTVSLLKDINIQPDTEGNQPNRESHSNPAQFTAFGNLTCFTAKYYHGIGEDYNSHTQELFITDGSEKGTLRVTDFKHASPAYDLNILATTNSGIYFTTSSGWTHVALYFYNGQSVVKLRDEIYSSIQDSKIFNEKLYVLIGAEVAGETEFWSTDGTIENTRKEGHLNANILQFYEYNNELFMLSDHGVDQNTGIYVYNSSGEVRQLVADGYEQPYAGSGYSYYITEHLGNLYIGGQSGLYVVEPVTSLNTPPVALATAPGQALKVFDGKTIQLKGDGSYDADGDELTYQWSVPDFEEYCTFSDANVANPTVTLMLPPKPEDYPEDAMYGEYYTIQLVVSDGIDSDTATLGVAVKANELPPVISIANDGQLVVNEGETLLIDASASYDPETGSLVNCTFEWKLNLDNKETILDSDSSKLYMIAPYVEEDITAKVYVKATDGKNESEWYEVDLDIHNIVPFIELSVSFNGSPYNIESYTLFFLNEDTEQGIQENPNQQNRYVLPEGRWKVMAVPTKPETDNFIVTFAPGTAIAGDAHIFDLNEDSEEYANLRLIPFGLTNGSGTISGKAERQIAVDEGGAIATVPLFSNNIVIYSLPDTIPVTTCMTNDQGEYTVQNLNWGKYLVVPSYLGISFDNGIDVELSVENASAVNIDFLLGIATSINSPEEITKLRVYPNPVQDIIWVKGINKSLNYKIYSINGNCLRTGTTVSSINIEELNKGIYLLELETLWLKHFIKIVKQ